MNPVILCGECGQGYYQVRETAVSCALCGSKKETAVYDVDRDVMSKEEEPKEQPKVKSESSDIQGKEASVKIAGPKTAESKPKKAPAKEQ